MYGTGFSTAHIDAHVHANNKYRFDAVIIILRGTSDPAVTSGYVRYRCVVHN